jgi:hypothetical protein
MSTKGKNWNWSDDAKRRHSEARKGKGYGGDHSTTHGLARTLEYNSWKKMMSRCYRETDKSYPLYGGRGITVCLAWHDPVNFCHDMIKRWGYRPKGFSLERVDVNGNYEMKNCCWVPMSMQAKNRRPWKHTQEGLAAIRAARNAKAP